MADQQQSSEASAAEESIAEAVVTPPEASGRAPDDLATHQRKIEELRSKPDEVRKSIAAKAKAFLSGLKPDKGPAASKAAEKAAPAAKEEPAKAASAAVDPGSVAAQFAEALNSRISQAEKAGETHAASAKEAIARAEAAEARLAQMTALAQKNPAAFLEAQKLNVDKFTARLLNGGEPTPQELAEAAQAAARTTEDKLAAAEARLKLVEQRYDADARAQILPTFARALEKDFPMVADELGAEAAFQHIFDLSQAAKRVLAPAEAFSEMEAALKAKVLTRAGKLGLEKKAAPAPKKTMTNRTVSTTGPKRAAETLAEIQAAGRAKIEQLKAQGRLA